MINGTEALYDVLIVGGGLSGTIAAITLARAGYRVGLIDRNETYPSEFRVEKVGGDQVDALARLGLLEAVAATSTRFDEIVNLRHGRVVDHTRSPHFGLLYDRFVSAMRGQLPPSVDFIVGRVVDIRTSPDTQVVTVADAAPLTARLVVLASGMSDILRTRLGIERRVIHERQSITFGFNVRDPNRAGPAAITCYGNTPVDGIDYLTLFPVGDSLRANLFTFLDHRHRWVKKVRQDPDAALAEALPEFAERFGRFEVEQPVQTWVMDLTVARDCVKDGIVLIGDAFQTSCPAAGTGLSRLLNDIEVLCGDHVSAWLATPGMGREKIAAYYANPRKIAMDRRVLELARYRRNLTIDTSLEWRMRRAALYLRRSVIHMLDRVSPALTRFLRGVKAKAA
jgi:2-polyprenyl-6-methoxyphenol hydroxylase-like FAD-dependent oxidoreductase